MKHKMRYDRENDVLVIGFDQAGQVDHAEQVGQTVLHLNEKGRTTPARDFEWA
jgi:hypothetical protein